MPNLSVKEAESMTKHFVTEVVNQLYSKANNKSTLNQTTKHNPSLPSIKNFSQTPWVHYQIETRVTIPRFLKIRERTNEPRNCTLQPLVKNQSYHEAPITENVESVDEK
jgi:hypothetical protein